MQSDDNQPLADGGNETRIERHDSGAGTAGDAVAERTEAQYAPLSTIASQAILANIVASAKDAIISMDEQQRITLFNVAAEKMFGYRASEVLGKPLSMLIPAEYQASHE